VGRSLGCRNAIASIFSIAEIADKYQITKDSAVDNTFTVHLPQNKVRFEQNENGLYVYISKKFERFQFMSSLDETNNFHNKSI
jgi:predicted DNA-binding protein YlxM (UPF0122 family)